MLIELRLVCLMFSGFTGQAVKMCRGRRWKSTPLIKQSQEHNAKWTVLVAWIRNDKASVRLVHSLQMNAPKGQTNPVLKLFWIHPNQAKKNLGHKEHQPSAHEVQKTQDEMATKAAGQT